MAQQPSAERTHPLIRRLRALTDLAEDELRALAGLLGDVRHVSADRGIADHAAEPGRLNVLVNGWAARSKGLPDGRRHFSMLLIPGDFCDIDALHVRRLDFGVTALTACDVSVVNRAELVALTRRHPAIGDVLTWLTFVENGVMGEALASHGRRSAREHLAHLLCELRARLAVVGQAGADGYALPVTQDELADAMGLTPVHVNRTLQGLRGDGLIELTGQRLTMLDPEGLKRVAGFDETYLHLDGMRPRAAAAA